MASRLSKPLAPKGISYANVIRPLAKLTRSIARWQKIALGSDGGIRLLLDPMACAQHQTISEKLA